MYSYKFFGKQIKTNTVVENTIFEKLNKNAMTLGTLQLLHNQKKHNQLLIDVKPSIGKYYLLPLVFNNLSTDNYIKSSDLFNLIENDVELNNCSKKVNTFNFNISESNTLDNIYKSTNKNISYIKMGSEDKEMIMIGAKNIIKKHKPIIQMKWIYQHVNEFKELVNIIREYNYSPLMIIGQELFLIPVERLKELKFIKKPMPPHMQCNPIFSWINTF